MASSVGSTCLHQCTCACLSKAMLADVRQRYLPPAPCPFIQMAACFQLMPCRQVETCVSYLILTHIYHLAKNLAGTPKTRHLAFNTLPSTFCLDSSLNMVFMPCLQVALQRLMAQAYHSVAAMYEDRHFLWGLAGNEQLLQRSMPARRAKVHLQPASPGPCPIVLSGLLSCFRFELL